MDMNLTMVLEVKGGSSNQGVNQDKKIEVDLFNHNNDFSILLEYMQIFMNEYLGFDKGLVQHCIMLPEEDDMGDEEAEEKFLVDADTSKWNPDDLYMIDYVANIAKDPKRFKYLYDIIKSEMGED